MPFDLQFQDRVFLFRKVFGNRIRLLTFEYLKQNLYLYNDLKDVYYNLPNNKKKMLTVPYGEDPNYIIASFLQSDEGLEVFKLLKNKLKNKK